MRLGSGGGTGIDRLDLHCARAAVKDSSLACASHYGVWRPHFFTQSRFQDLTAAAAGLVSEDVAAQADARWGAVRQWLLDTKTPIPIQKAAAAPWAGMRAFLTRARFHCADDAREGAPADAVYFNAAQAGLEHPRFFHWLRARPDVAAVFLIHDLLPLDLPDYFRPGYRALFARRIATVMRFAQGIVTTSRVVSQRLEAEFRVNGRSAPPIVAIPPPSPLDGAAPTRDPHLAAISYFVMVGTLEPRKNHELILQVWRALGARAPLLVLAGNRGPASEPILRLLSEDRLLSARVRHVENLSRAGLQSLIAHARALLLPSFAEGYGLPAVEALTLGAPLIAADIPVLRETARGLGCFVSPYDASAWTQAILRHDAQRPAAQNFEASSWENYFKSLKFFWNSLPRSSRD